MNQRIRERILRFSCGKVLSVDSDKFFLKGRKRQFIKGKMLLAEDDESIKIM